MPAGAPVGDRETLVEAGTFLASARDVARIVVGSRGNRPVFVEDVAPPMGRAMKRYAGYG
jgi:hypothetical protein